jgi:phosphatidylglycerophosphatase C
MHSIPRRSNVPKKTKTLALFDFDHTITTADTFLDIIIFLFGKIRFAAGMLVCSPALILYLLGIIPNYKAKSRVISHYFKGMPKELFEMLCSGYARSGIGRVLRAEAIERIRWHKKHGHRVIIISASLESWIKPWAKESGIDDVIATIPEFKDGKVTGKLATKNCCGKEKLSRFLEKYPDAEKYTVYAYGDSSGDREILDFADYSFYRKFE